MFLGPFEDSIIKRAITKHIVDISYVNIRDFATDKHKSVDDHPYGGGIGMVMRVDVVDKAIAYAKTKFPNEKTRVVLLDAGGTPYNQKRAEMLKDFQHLILVCGHYEGVDERIKELVDEEISIGDYILTGGELPAMILVDSVVRLLPRTLVHKEATTNESFNPIHPLLEYPQYTKPNVYKRKRVPSILLGGNHESIAKWREEQSLIKTKEKRPDLLR